MNFDFLQNLSRPNQFLQMDRIETLNDECNFFLFATNIKPIIQLLKIHIKKKIGDKSKQKTYIQNEISFYKNVNMRITNHMSHLLDLMTEKN